MIDAIIGAAVGFGLSIILWVLQFVWFVPKLTFDEELDKDGKGQWQISYKNRRRRGAIDISITAAVHFDAAVKEHGGIKKLLPSPPPPPSGRNVVHPITLLGDYVVRTASGHERFCTLVFQRPPGDDGIDPLKSLLTGRTGVFAYFRVQILAYDQFTGTRKYFGSRPYYWNSAKSRPDTSEAAWRDAVARFEAGRPKGHGERP